MEAERKARGLGSVEEMLPMLTSPELASVAGGEEGWLLFMLRVSMGAASGFAFTTVDTLTVDSLSLKKKNISHSCKLFVPFILDVRL